MLPVLITFCDIIREHPFCLEPFKAGNEYVRNVFGEKGFQLLDTVKKTTLLYHQGTDSFFKIVHPLAVKHKIRFLLSDISGSLYRLNGRLCAAGVPLPPMLGYGTVRSGRRPFYVVRRAEGRSLYDLLIRGGGRMPLEVYERVVDTVALFHHQGYWFRDAHLSHIFVDRGSVTGFIDLDSIRRNFPFFLRNLAKDLAGLNHPGLRLSASEKILMAKRYCARMGITKEEQFLGKIAYYSERRWKE